MKQLIMLEVVKRIKRIPNFKRKLKIFAVVGVLGFFVTTGLLIWAGVAAFNFASDKAAQVMHSPQTSAQVESLKTKASEFSTVKAAGCWAKAQSLVAVEPWLVRPALENLNNLKIACFGQGTPVSTSEPICIGHECTEMKTLMRTASQGEML